MNAVHCNMHTKCFIKISFAGKEKWVWVKNPAEKMLNTFKTTDVFTEIRESIVQKKGLIHKKSTTRNWIVITVLELPNSVKKQKAYAMMTLMQRVERAKASDCSKPMRSYLKSEHKRNPPCCSFSVTVSLRH